MDARHKPTDPDPESILVVLSTWVGDFVMATPTLRALRDRFPDAHIVFLVESNLRPLLASGDWMDECIEWPARDQRQPWQREHRMLVRKLRQRRFDWAVLLPNSFRSALVAWLAGAKRRFGYNRDGRGFLLTDRLPVTNRQGRSFVPMPLVEYYADLAQAIGCRRPGHHFELCTSQADDASVQHHLQARGIADHHPLVVISPGAKYGAAKCWLTDRFAALSDRLVGEEGAAIVITCGPGEESIAQAISRDMKQPHHVFDDPRLSLGALQSLIKRADLLVCNDAGPRHFAKAFDVGVVTVFGPTHRAWTDTDYPLEAIVRIDVDCGPCQQRTCPLGHLKCMTGVTVDMVAEACKARLAARTAVRR